MSHVVYHSFLITRIGNKVKRTQNNINTQNNIKFKAKAIQQQNKHDSTYFKTINSSSTDHQHC